MRRGLWLPAAVLGVAAVTALGLVTASRQPATPTPRSTSSIAEQQGHRGVNTFTNYHNASGLGQRVDPGAWVQVSCKVYDPYIGTANPDGYWYRIASAPWNDPYYAPANTFINGDPWTGPYTHNTDFAVPDCGSAPQPPAPALSVSLAQGSPATHGYWYAISLGNSAPNTSVSVACYDSVSPNGFRTFSLKTNGSGSASIAASGCYSGDGPDHWVIAGGVGSNHVSWGSGGTTAPGPTQGPAANPSNGHTTINGVDVGIAQNQPHAWGACTVQDFKQGPYGWVIVSYTGGTHIVRNGMLWGWVDNGGAPGFGCPVNDEHVVGGRIKQDFTQGSLYWVPGMDHAQRLPSASPASTGDPCIQRYSGGGSMSTRSVFGGSITRYDRKASLYQACEGFGAPEGLTLTPAMQCAIIAAAANFSGVAVLSVGSATACTSH